jgi:hypothetical protein
MDVVLRAETSSRQSLISAIEANLFEYSLALGHGNQGQVYAG